MVETMNDLDSLRDLAAVALDRLAREQDAEADMLDRLRRCRGETQPLATACDTARAAVATSRVEAVRELDRLRNALPHGSDGERRAHEYLSAVTNWTGIPSAALRKMAAAVRGVVS